MFVWLAMRAIAPAIWLTWLLFSEIATAPSTMPLHLHDAVGDEAGRLLRLLARQSG